MKKTFATFLAAVVSAALFAPMAQARTPEVRASRQNFEDVRAPRLSFADTLAPRQNFEDVRAPRQNFDDVRAPRAGR